LTVLLESLGAVLIVHPPLLRIAQRLVRLGNLCKVIRGPTFIGVMLQRLNPVVFLQRSIVSVAIDAQDSIVIILSRGTDDDDSEEEREKRLRESHERRSRGRTSFDASARPHGSSERSSAAMCDAPGGFWIDLVRGVVVTTSGLYPIVF